MELDDIKIQPAITSLIAEELAVMRQIDATRFISTRWNGDTVIGSDDLHVDSLELVSLATSCAERFGLQQLGAGDYLLSHRRISDWADLAATGIQQSGTVSFRTSGTTGPAKVIQHRIDDLEQEIQVLAKLMGDARRVVSLVPAHHIYGFIFSVLLPTKLGIPVYDQGRVSGMLPSDITSGDWLVGFPLRWRQILRLGQPLPPGVAAVTSTAPCPSDLIYAMQELGLDKMLSVYGATETAGVGYRLDPQAPYRLFPYWRWKNQTLCRTRDNGEEMTIEAQDDLLFDDAHHFWPNGRKDEVIQIAGCNIRPADVATRLVSHSLVAQCSVYLDQSNGEPRLGADVVPAQNADKNTLEGELRQWAKKELTSVERPIRWQLVEQLATTATGKIRGWSAST